MSASPAAGRPAALPWLAALLLSWAPQVRAQALLPSPGPWQPSASLQAPAGWQPAGGVSAHAPWAAAAGLATLGSWQSVLELRPLAMGSIPEADGRSAAELAALPRTQISDQTGWLFGIGGGIRFGDSFGISPGEPSSGVVMGRLGTKLSRDLSLSLRPTLIFGNVDLLGVPNNQLAFQMPLTLDLFRRSFVSPYIGAGLATNTDSTGATNPMLTGGLDFNLYENLTLGLNVNYIIQTDIGDADWEAMTVLYLRF